MANPLRFCGIDTFGMRFDPVPRLSFEVEGGRAVKEVLLRSGGRYEGVRKLHSRASRGSVRKIHLAQQRLETWMVSEWGQRWFAPDPWYEGVRRPVVE